MSQSDSFPEIPSDDVDLGLGLGLRPGSLPPAANSTSPSSVSAFDGTFGAELFTWVSVDSLTSAVGDEDKSNESIHGRSAIKSRMSDLLERLSDKLRPKKFNLNSNNESGYSSIPGTPVELNGMQQTSTPVSLGTSLRQQKILYEQELAEIQRRRKVESVNRPAVKSGMTSIQHHFVFTRGKNKTYITRLRAD